MNSSLEHDVLEYQRWRDRLVGAIDSFRARLDTSRQVDVEQSLRMYDLIESLRGDRMLLAFIAEYSRGKTELINALFFSGYKRRLLPSGIGRTTMCPTEIFHDPAEPPYLRLLPIETRETDESVAALKRKPIEWIRIALDVDDADELAATLAKVGESRTVTGDYARRLGLYDPTGTQLDVTGSTDATRSAQVQVPAWRHALINFPHPMLTAGLAILDTPGLNALGTEPELTLSMIPNAHAVLFLLAMDTGVTRSDLELWQRHVQHNVTRSVAVLNKVDLVWDGLNSPGDTEGEIERQLDATASVLGLARSNVLPMSAQKALVGRIRGDEAMLARSGVRALESLLAKMIPERRRIIAERVSREFGVLVDSSFDTVMARLRSTASEYDELSKLRGKNQGMVGKMLLRLHQDRAAYQQTAQNFRNTQGVVMKQGALLQSNLDPGRIERICGEYRQKLGDQVFTVRLMRMMQDLFDHFERETAKVMTFANQIKGLVDTVYVSFHENYGFAKLSPPPFSLDRFSDAILQLRESTTAFCASPATVMQPQGIVIRKFYDLLVDEAKSIFAQVSAEIERWLMRALSPLNMQLKEHEAMLDRRLLTLRKVHDNTRSLDVRLRELEHLRSSLQHHCDELAAVREVLVTASPAAMDADTDADAGIPPAAMVA